MTTTPEDVQELMDTIADAQADIGHVANVLANESTVGIDGVDETGMISKYCSSYLSLTIKNWKPNSSRCWWQRKMKIYRQ